MNMKTYDFYTSKYPVKNLKYEIANLEKDVH